MNTAPNRGTMVRMSARAIAVAAGVLAVGTGFAVAANTPGDEVLTAHYALNEPGGATTAADISGNDHPPLTQVQQENPLGSDESVTFGARSVTAPRRGSPPRVTASI